MASVAQLLENNKAIAASHQALPLISEFAGLGVDLPHTLVVTCSDPRCVPEKYLGFGVTDGVVVIRNAGGRVTPDITSMLALDNLLTINNILIIHHTDCGTLLYKDEQVKENLKKRVSAEYSSAIDGMFFGAIADLEQSVVDDIATVRKSPYIRKELGEHTTGYIFDIKTGLLKEVASK